MIWMGMTEGRKKVKELQTQVIIRKRKYKHCTTPKFSTHTVRVEI